MTEKEGKKKEKGVVERYRDGEISLRQAAEEEEKDLHEMIEILEAQGCFSSQSFKEASGFEKRQFDYIVDKIVTAIVERVGEGKLTKAVEDLKADKADFRETAKELDLDLTDFALVIERKGWMTEDEIKAELKQTLEHKRNQILEKE